MRCKFCASKVEDARARANILTCSVCGDTYAKIDIASKRSQVAPAFNKGGLQFIGGANFSQALLDAGRKTSSELNDFVPVASQNPSRVVRVRRKVGVMWTPNGDCFSLYAGDDPAMRGASRFVIFSKENES